MTGLPELGLLGFAGGIGDDIYSAVNFESAADRQSKNFAELAAAGGFDPSSIDYDFNAAPVAQVVPVSNNSGGKSKSSALEKEMSKQQKNISAVESGTYKKSMGGF